ncbi:unnamed protein product [Rotaria sp. Silwood2]|nr:unnamed protein product [Rotaria sp. Silwood2]
MTAVKPPVVRFNVNQQCPIQYVTVYNDRAEVTRILRHHFDVEGIYDLVLDGFSIFVNETSMHVSGGTSKACTILEVSHQIRHEDIAPSSDLTSLDNLQSQLGNVETDLEMHQRELTRLTKQREWLDGRSIKLMNQDGPCTTNDMENIRQFLEFYHNTLLKLDDNTVREEEEMKKLKSRQEALKTQIDHYGAAAQASRRKIYPEVTITVHIASGELDVALEVSYLISNCFWSASYDFRVSSAEANQQQTQLTYYGIIVNKSQENWLDANFSLSTAKPSLGGTPPKLNTLNIDYYKPLVIDSKQIPKTELTDSIASTTSKFAVMHESTPTDRWKDVFRSFRAKSLLAHDPTIEDKDAEFDETKVNILASKTAASMSSISFVIPRRSTIDSNGKPHKVTIGVLDLPSTFTYTVVPKISPHAYLKALTVNTSDKQLLAGPVSVFMDNNFVTHSSIDNVYVCDTFDLPLGTDASVKVEYKPVKKMVDTQGLISKIHHETCHHETKIVNMKSTEITVFVYEQVPLSSDEKIKVKLITPDLRQKDYAQNCMVTMNDRNNLEWKCVLQPHEEFQCPLEYTLEWPKDKRVELQEG